VPGLVSPPALADDRGKAVSGSAEASFGRMLPSPWNWLGRIGSLMLDCIDSALCRRKCSYKINSPTVGLKPGSGATFGTAASREGIDDRCG
jgi:hypothetical protein